MSLARIYRTKKSQKVWMCGKCRREIPKGSPVISFAVGFRGREQKRCGDNPLCEPKPSELESSQSASVYAAQEDANVEDCHSLEDLEALRDQVAEACREVANEYESSEMYERNEDLQQRADTLNSTADELESWDGGDEPEDEIDCGECDGTGNVSPTDVEEECDDCQGTGKITNTDAHSDWLETARASLRDAIDSMEIP